MSTMKEHYRKIVNQMEEELKSISNVIYSFRTKLTSVGYICNIRAILVSMISFSLHFIAQYKCANVKRSISKVVLG